MLTTKTIGNKIAEARKRVNISQAQLAERLFISPQAVGKWERGESMPDIITFNRLAEILGVDLNYFSDGFQSANTGTAANGTLDEQPLPFGKQKRDHSWDMSGGNWVDADFSGLKNLKEKFSSSNMQRCRFVGSDLSGLLLKRNHIDGCDFSNSDFNSSHIQNSYLTNNVLQFSRLNESEFLECFIKACDFSGANLDGVKFKSGTFVNNTMINAVWHYTSFIGMQIGNIVFDGTIDDCYFENCSFYKVTFRNATLINTFFKNRKLKGIQFIDCQADRMTFEFLKNGKADLTGIRLV